MSLRRALVTGAAGTFGAEIAAGLVAAGYETLCVVRDSARGDALIARLNGGAIVETSSVSSSYNAATSAAASSTIGSKRGMARSVICDLESADDILRMAASIGPAALDIFVGNAAVAYDDRRVSASGIESLWCTNVLGYHRCFLALLPLLKLSPSPRVVYVASQYAGGLDLRDVEFKTRPYEAHEAYRQSKQANRMSAKGWSLREPAIDVYCCHPGTADSKVARGLSVSFSATAAAARAGAVTPLFCALTPSKELVASGAYYVNSKPSRCPFSEDAKAVSDLMALLDSYK